MCSGRAYPHPVSSLWASLVSVSVTALGLVPGICPVALGISESSSKEAVVFSCMAVAGIIMGAYWPLSAVGPL